MKKIEPYKNVNEAIKSLDNGGRFYSNAIKASDGIINQAELEKVGKVSNDKQQMILFLQMSILKLEQSEKISVFSKLDSNLMKIYEKYKPQELRPCEANLEGKLLSNAIITGCPKLIDSESEVEGFVMFPTMLGNIPTFKKTPLMEVYDVYKIKDQESAKTFLVVHPKSTEKLPNKKMIIGGLIKELNKTEGGVEAQGSFLEAIYHYDC